LNSTKEKLRDCHIQHAQLIEADPEFLKPLVELVKLSDQKTHPSDEQLKSVEAALEKVTQMVLEKSWVTRFLATSFGVHEDTVRRFSKAANLDLETRAQQEINDSFSKALFSVGYRYDIERKYDAAIKWYLPAANLGYVHAQHNLGLIFREGKNGTKNLAEALRWYQKSAEQGDASSISALGEIALFEDSRSEANDQLAYQKLMQAAQLNHPPAVRLIGWMHDQGRAVAVNHSEAIKWYERAIKLKDARAMSFLGYSYWAGEGTTKDRAKAEALFRQSAEQGDTFGQYRLGLMYRDGDAPLKQDHKLAFEWFTKAANQGHAYSQVELGYAYEAGNGTSQSTPMAVQWYERAAKQDSIAGLTNVGYLYRFGQGVPQDLVKAKDYFVRASDLGGSRAKRLLAGMYREGVQVEKNMSIAVALWRQAIANGDTESMFQLSEALYFGTEVVKDHKEAAELALKAAELGHSGSQFRLGWMYTYGYGVAQDYERSRYWYEKAVAKGHATAMNNLGWAYHQGHGVAVDYAKAKELYLKASESGNSEAEFTLGEMLELGEGSAIDAKEAIKWYLKAADRKHAKAIAALKRLKVLAP
jgi:TPR repeat protein